MKMLILKKAPQKRKIFSLSGHLLYLLPKDPKLSRGITQISQHPAERRQLYRIQLGCGTCPRSERFSVTDSELNLHSLGIQTHTFTGRRPMYCTTIQWRANIMFGFDIEVYKAGRESKAQHNDNGTYMEKIKCQHNLQELRCFSL